MAQPYDRARADAESRLEALDDAALVEPPPDGEAGDSVDASELAGTTDAAVQGVVAPDEYGVHVDDPGSDLLDDDMDVGLRDDAEATALDGLAETFNARDLDGMMQIVAADGEAPGLLGYDRESLPTAVEDLWQRRPTCCLTRGYHADEHIGVLWEHDGSSWWRVAAVHVDDVQEGMIGVIAFSDDAALLDALVADPPDPNDLEEGARWSEWDEGADAESGHNHI